MVIDQKTRRKSELRIVVRKRVCIGDTLTWQKSSFTIPEFIELYGLSKDATVVDCMRWANGSASSDPYAYFNKAWLVKVEFCWDCGNIPASKRLKCVMGHRYCKKCWNRLLPIPFRVALIG